MPSPLLPEGYWVLPGAEPSTAGIRSNFQNLKKRWRWGSESGKRAVNRVRVLKKRWAISFSAQEIWGETKRDLFSFLKQQKAAVSYGKGFPLLLLRLPAGVTLWLLGLVPSPAGSGPGFEVRRGSSTLFGWGKQQTGERPRHLLGFTSKGDEMRGAGGTPR